MNQEQLQIQRHIDAKKEELEKVRWFWQLFLELNEISMFSPQTHTDVQAKVSSRIAQIERSIRDHEVLL